MSTTANYSQIRVHFCQFWSLVFRTMNYIKKSIYLSVISIMRINFLFRHFSVKQIICIFKKFGSNLCVPTTGEDNILSTF